MLYAAGLRLTQIIPTPSPMSVIEIVRVWSKERRTVGWDEVRIPAAAAFSFVGA